MRSLVRLTIPALLALGLLGACAGDGDEVRVFAASSLTEVMPLLVAGFRAEHAEIKIAVAYGGSQALATQIEEGAPADVFLSANPQQAERLSEQGLADNRLEFARNELVIAVGSGSELATLEDLAVKGVRIAVGAHGVPVGELTTEALLAQPAAIQEAIEANVITRDPNVRAVLTRVEVGEAEAAFVYRTDAASTPGLRAIELVDPPSTTYVALTIAESGVVGGDARRFLDYLGGAAAAAILRDAGFEPIAVPG